MTEPQNHAGLLANANSRLAALESRGAERERENGSLRDELRAANARAEEAGVEAAALREQLARAEQERDAAMRANEEMCDDISTLPGFTRRDAIANARKAIIDLRETSTQLARAKECAEECLNDFSRARSDRDEAREQLAAAQADHGKRIDDMAKVFDGLSSGYLARAESAEKRIAELEAARQPAPLPEWWREMVERIAAMTDAEADDPAETLYAQGFAGGQRSLARALLSLPAPSAPATAPNVARACELLRRCTDDSRADYEWDERLRRRLVICTLRELEAPVAQAAPAKGPSQEPGRCECAPHEECVTCEPTEQVAPARDAGGPTRPWGAMKEHVVEPTQQAAPVIVGRAATYAEIVEVSKALKAERQAAPREEPPALRAIASDLVDALSVPGHDRKAPWVRLCAALGRLKDADHWPRAPAPAPSLARLHALADTLEAKGLFVSAEQVREALAAGAELPGLPEGSLSEAMQKLAARYGRSLTGWSTSPLPEFAAEYRKHIGEYNADAPSFDAWYAAHHLAHASKGGA